MIKLAAITLYESGKAIQRDLPGIYADHESAISSALDYARGIVGPARDGYRLPEIAVVRDDERLSPPVVKIGRADIDPSYTMIYPYQHHGGTK